MILKEKLLIISYIPYVCRDGGFCIYITPSNKVESREIELSDEEVSELILNSQLRYKNRTPNYLTLLNEYFDELLKTTIIL